MSFKATSANPHPQTGASGIKNRSTLGVTGNAISVPFPIGTVSYQCPGRTAIWLVASGPVQITTEPRSAFMLVNPDKSVE
jgi:hypothetical protein